MKPGIYYDVPMEEYKKWPGVHKSMFHYILKSGLHFKHYLDNGEESSPLMDFGNLVDTLLFEPAMLESRYTKTPETYPAIVKKVQVDKRWNWNATYCKDWRDTLLSEKPDIRIVTAEDIERASRICDRIESHPEAGKWLKDSKAQVSLCWTDPETGIACKGRVDALNEERIIDLKVTDNPHPSAFSRIVNQFLYHAGAAFYHDGFLLAQGKTPDPNGPTIPFSFIAAESEAPFDVVAYNLGLESFQVGRIVYREALQRYVEYTTNDEYPGYSNVAEDIEIPAWVLNRIQMQGVIE